MIDAAVSSSCSAAESGATFWANEDCAKAQMPIANAAIDAVSLYFIWICPPFAK
jgi:hypothetical protein